MTLILIFGWHGEPLDTVRAWVARAWSEVVGGDNPNHPKAGTSTAHIRKPRRFMSYLSKPDPSTSPHTRRSRGTFRAGLLPLAPAVRLDLTAPELVKVRRLMLKLERASAPAGRPRRRLRGQNNPTRHTITAGNTFLEDILRERATGKPDDTPPAARYLGPAGKGEHPHHPAPDPPAQTGEVATPAGMIDT